MASWCRNLLVCDRVQTQIGKCVRRTDAARLQSQQFKCLIFFEPIWTQSCSVYWLPTWPETCCPDQPKPWQYVSFVEKRIFCIFPAGKFHFLTNTRFPYTCWPGLTWFDSARPDGMEGISPSITAGLPSWRWVFFLMKTSSARVKQFPNDEQKLLQFFTKHYKFHGNLRTAFYVESVVSCSIKLDHKIEILGWTLLARQV